MADELTEDAPLTAEDILTFGPVVEAQVWTVSWLAEARAPSAQAAGRPKLGKVFNEQGVGKAVLIRPCISRGKRIRGLSPIYTPKMLEAHAGVFGGWPQYLDHVPAELAESMAKRGRSVKELGGQVLRSYWQQAFVQEADEEFGYQPGGVLAEVWANEFVRKLVGENPNVLHNSIAAWPTSGKPGPVPWKPAVKGMVIEGIRRQPQGSVDYVPRGGAGGRLLLAEGDDPDARPWPEPKWTQEDAALVVSLAERFYASPAMTEPPNFAEMQPAELRAWVQENAAHLIPALREEAADPAPASGAAALTADDVQRMIREQAPSAPSQEQIEEMARERAEDLISERETQRSLATEAAALIEAAEGVPASWKADLKARYALLPSGPQPALLVESETDSEGHELSEMDVLRARVQADLDRTRDLIAEAQGKPRVRGEGGATSSSAGDERGGGRGRKGDHYWRTRFAEMGIVESEDAALSIHGVEKAEG